MAKTIDTVEELFRIQIEQKKFSAGFLLSGDENEKKRQVATRFAKALNCENKKPSVDCTCNSCHKIDSGNHPDVRWYGADEEERSIKMEAVRELQEWLHLKPYEGRVKVFILNKAERLTVDAQNALLKSLEEPPPNSVLILLARKRSDLLETVISRLQEIKVPKFEEKEIVNALTKEEVDIDEAKFLARYAHGNLGYAKALSESKWFKKKNDFLKALLLDPTTGFDALAQKQRKEVLDFLALLGTWVRDSIIMKSGGETSLLIHENLIMSLQKFTKNRSFEELYQFYQQIEITAKAVEENANSKLALTKLQVDWKEFTHA